MIVLRDYQNDIVNRAISTDKSTLIQIPTGGGKTLIAKHIAIKLINQNLQVLFIAPKIVLMKQTEEVFKGLKPQIVHKTNNYDNNHPILISTIQTASRRALNPDIIIVDEVHYGYSGEMLSKLKENNPNSRIIGLSATPYDEEGKLLKGFDVILNDYDMKYMIKNNYLTSLDSYALTKVDLSQIDIVRGDYDENQLFLEMSKKERIVEIVETTKSYVEKSTKTIIFAINIKHAEILAKAYREHGIFATTLHSDLNELEKEEVINTFKKGYTRVLVSVLMLTTGFDVPEVDLGIIARPTRSQNLYKQMVGRILRKSPGKKRATLLDCGGVIENLGMPLDPIHHQIIDKVDNTLYCYACNSSNLKLRKKQDKSYWLCEDCGFQRDVKKQSYKCEKCFKEYFPNQIQLAFSNDKKKLFLLCACGYKTLISEYISEEILVKIEDSFFIEPTLSKNSKYLSFIEAREFVHGLHIESIPEWKNIVQIS